MSSDLIIGLVYIAMVIAMIGGVWKMFEKAGEPGWASIVPFYNAYLLIKIAGRPGWWMALYFLPLVSLIPALIVPIDIADRFGKGTGFGLGLAFLPFVFYPILGFGDAEYSEPEVSEEDEE